MGGAGGTIVPDRVVLPFIQMDGMVAPSDIFLQGGFPSTLIAPYVSGVMQPRRAPKRFRQSTMKFLSVLLSLIGRTMS